MAAPIRATKSVFLLAPTPATIAMRTKIIAIIAAAMLAASCAAHRQPGDGKKVPPCRRVDLYEVNNGTLACICTLSVPRRCTCTVLDENFERVVVCSDSAPR